MKTKLLVIFICFFGAIVLLSPSTGMATESGAAAKRSAVAKEHAGEATKGEHGSGNAEHGDPYAKVFALLALILFCAGIGRFGAKKLKQSPVLGELGIGIIVGAIIYQMGGPILTIVRHNDIVQGVTHKVLTQKISWEDAVEASLEEAGATADVVNKVKPVLLSPHFDKYFKVANSILLFLSLGVILLLFMVGLESSLEEMQAVGLSALLVALGGVVFSFVFGYFTMLFPLPQGASHNIPIFVGAALCATSIGITARVFQDMGKVRMAEAKIVLGAAVLDDVLGLIVVAVVIGIVTSGSVKLGTIGVILLKASIFLGAIVIFGAKLIEKDIAIHSRLAGEHLKLLYPFALLMIFSWLADKIGLATIVGAFGAGLIVKEEFFGKYETPGESKPTIETIISPIEGVFALVFFVLMGLQVDVSTFADMKVLLMGLILTVVAVISKGICGLLAKKGNDKLIIGIGMVPRGEVGLIFASIGKSLGVLDDLLFSVVIIFVLLTTLVTPPLLKWSIDRKEKAACSVASYGRFHNHRGQKDHRGNQ